MSVFARPIDPVENRLLAALPRDEYERLLLRLGHLRIRLAS